MKSTNDFQTSNPETVTISRAEYEEENARLAVQDERISQLENQVSVLMEVLRLARHKIVVSKPVTRNGKRRHRVDICYNTIGLWSVPESRGLEKAYLRHYEVMR